MKTLIATTLLVLASLAVKAQNYELSYDPAGNRVQRKVLVLGNARFASSPKTTDTVGTHNFQLFPNPTSGSLEINASQGFLEKEDQKIMVYDLSGNLVMQKTPKDQNLNIDLSTLQQGAYIIRLTAKEFSHEWKVVKM
jgi:hypothetical protein